MLIFFMLLNMGVQIQIQWICLINDFFFI